MLRGGHRSLARLLNEHGARARVAARPAAYVLDSFALLSYWRESGDATRSIHPRGPRAGGYRCIVMINLGEALYITERERGLVAAGGRWVRWIKLPREIVPISRRRVLDAAHIKPGSHLVARPRRGACAGPWRYRHEGDLRPARSPMRGSRRRMLPERRRP